MTATKCLQWQERNKIKLKALEPLKRRYKTSCPFTAADISEIVLVVVKAPTETCSETSTSRRSSNHQKNMDQSGGQPSQATHHRLTHVMATAKKEDSSDDEDTNSKDYINLW